MKASKMLQPMAIAVMVIGLVLVGCDNGTTSGTGGGDLGGVISQPPSSPTGAPAGVSVDAQGNLIINAQLYDINTTTTSVVPFPNTMNADVSAYASTASGDYPLTTVTNGITGGKLTSVIIPPPPAAALTSVVDDLGDMPASWVKSGGANHIGSISLEYLEYLDSSTSSTIGFDLYANPVITTDGYGNYNPQGDSYMYMYSDGDVVISGSGQFDDGSGGKYSMAADIKLAKGWNCVLMTADATGGGKIISRNPPANAQWVIDHKSGTVTN
ncbi:MAG: hypothetical protein FWC60_00595 [Firmicutes bacterium]|nr:hypothetical protein [Bacillota bacterium]